MSAIVALIVGLQKAAIQCATVAPLTVTQIILPVAIISSVVVVRQVSPPETVTPCSYRSTSMPTDGTLTFVQSFGCNLDNECLPPNYTESPQEAQAKSRFKKLDKSLDPIIGNATKMTQLKKLPAATNAIVKIGNAAASNNLTSLLSSLNLRVGSLFYNETLVVRFLTDQARLLTRDAATALMNAQLNLTALLSMFGGSGIAEIVCDPAQLVQFLSVNYEGDKNATVAAQISDALCKLDPAKANNITDFLFSQLNIGKALSLFKQVASFTYNYNLTLGLTDLETLIRLMPKFASLRSLDAVSIAQWGAGVMQQVQKLISAPTLLTDLAFLSQSAEQLTGLLTSLVSTDPAARSAVDTLKMALGAVKNLVAYAVNLQSTMLSSTLDKMLPADVVQMLQASGISMASLQSAPLTLTGIFQLLGLDTVNVASVASQVCNGSLDLRLIFNSPASYPALMEQVKQFVCSNSTAFTRLLGSANLTQFFSDFVMKASLNSSQLVSSVFQLVQGVNNGTTVFQQLVAFVTDGSWANIMRLNVTADGSASAVAALSLLGNILDRAFQVEPVRSQILIAANVALLELEVYRLNMTLDQEFVSLVLTDPRVANWSVTAATSVAGPSALQSLFTVPLHPYLFGYTHGMSDVREVQAALCQLPTLQEVVDSGTRDLLRMNGSEVPAVQRLFCNSTDVFVILCDFFRAKLSSVMTRATQLATPTNFSVLASIADGFRQVADLDQKQRQQSATWLSQAMTQLSQRTRSPAVDYNDTIGTFSLGLVTKAYLLYTLAATKLTDSVRRDLDLLQPEAVRNAIVVSLKMQTAGFFVTNSLMDATRRDVWLQMAQTPQAGEAMSAVLQLLLQAQASVPVSWKVTSPALPLCNGSSLLDAVPTLAAYPAGMRLNRTFCALFTGSPQASESLRMFADTLRSVESLTNVYNTSAGTLTEAALGYSRQYLMYLYQTRTRSADSTAMGAATVNITQMLQLQILSPAYDLFYAAVTANSSDKAVSQSLMEINYQLNLQYQLHYFIWQSLTQLNGTRDLQRAVLDTPELAELIATVSPAVKDLMRSALDGSLSAGVLAGSPSAGSQPVCSAAFQPASVFGTAAGSLATVRRFSDALCALVRATNDSVAKSRLGQLMAWFDTAKKADLSTTRFNVTAEWLLMDQLQQLWPGLMMQLMSQPQQLLPSSVNITDLLDFANKQMADLNNLFATNLTTALQMLAQVALQQVAAPSIGPTLQAHLSSITQVIGQLTGLLKASNNTLTALIKGTEADQLLALLNQAPAMLPTLLRTAYELQANPALALAWTSVATNPGALCSNLTGFTQLLRVPESADAAGLQSAVCRVLGLNATAMLGQIFQRLPALGSLIDQVSTCWSPGFIGCSVNATVAASSADFFAAIQSATSTFQALMANASLAGVRMEIFNSSYLALLLGPELQRFSSLSSNGTLDIQLLQRYITAYSQMINSVASSMNATSVDLSVLSGLLDWQKALLDVVAGGPSKLQAMLNGSADGQRLWRLLTSLPSLMQVLVNTVTQYPTRLMDFQAALASQMTANVSAGGDPVLTALCRLNLTQFAVIPPGVSFDLVTFQSDLCQLNLTTLDALPAPLKTLFMPSFTGALPLTPERLTAAINSTAAAVTATNWTAATDVWMPLLQPWISSLSGFSTMSPTLPSVPAIFTAADALIALLPAEARQQLNSALSLTSLLLDLATGSVNQLLVGNSSSAADALYQLPETQKLLRLVSENFTDLLLSGAYNQRPLQYLLTLNQTEAFMYLCLSQNATLMAYMGLKNFTLTSPPGVCTGCIVQRICSLDVNALMTETQGFSGALAASMSPAVSNLTFALLSTKAMQLQLLIAKLANSSAIRPPGIISPEAWGPAVQLLTAKYSSTGALSDNAQELLLTFYLAMKDPIAQKAFASLLSGVLGQWAPRLQALLASKSLYELFKGMPLLDALYNLTLQDGGSAALRLALDAAIRSPGRLVDIILNPTMAADSLARLCNGSLDLAALLSVNVSLDTRTVQRSLCALMQDVGNVNAVSSRILEQLGISIMGSNSSSSSGSANLTAVQSQAQALFTTLQSLLATNPTDLMPQLNLSVYGQLLNAYGYLNSPTADSLLVYYSTLYTMLKAYLPASEFQRAQDAITSGVALLQAVVDYAGSAVDSTGRVDLSQLVANVTSAEAVLQQVLRPVNLTGLQVMTAKLPQLYAIVMANASSLCSLTLTDYFVLPATLNVSQLQRGICGLAANFQTEVMANANLTKLMMVIVGFPSANQTLDFYRVWQLYSSLVAKVTALQGPLTNVTYRGANLASLMGITGLPALETMFPDVATLPGQLSLIFGFVDQVSSTLDAMAPSADPVLTSVLRIVQAALASIQSLLKSWSSAGQISLGSVFGNASRWIDLLGNSSITVGDLASLVNISLRADKLAALIAKPPDAAVAAICNSSLAGFSAYFEVASPVAALDRVLRIAFCDPAMQERLRSEILSQLGLDALIQQLTGNASALTLTPPKFAGVSSQLQQIAAQLAILLQAPLTVNVNGTIVDSLMKLLGSGDALGQLASVLQAQFSPATNFNFLAPLLEGAYSLLKSSMPVQAPQLDLAIAVAYEVLGRVNAEVASLLSQPVTMETLLRADNVLSPLLKSLSATDANSLAILVQASLNSTEFNRWIAMNFTTAMCTQNLNNLFVSTTVKANLTALQTSLCSLGNGSALTATLGAMFNSRNSMLEMLATGTVKQAVSMTSLFGLVRDLSGSLPNLGSLNTSALDAKVQALLAALQTSSNASASMITDYKAYLSSTLANMGSLTLPASSAATMAVVAAKLQQSADLLTAVVKLVNGQASPETFAAALSAVLAMPAGGGSNSTGDVVLSWQILGPALMSAISVGELLSNASSFNVTLNALAALQKVATLPSVASLFDAALGAKDPTMPIQQTLQISAAFFAVLLSTRFDNLTSALVQPSVLQQLGMATGSPYFQTELNVLMADPAAYISIPGGTLRSVVCNASQFDLQLPGVRSSAATMLRANDSRVDAQVRAIQTAMCDGAKLNQLLLQQLNAMLDVTKLVNVATSFNAMSPTQLLQQLLAGDFSLNQVVQTLMNYNSSGAGISKLIVQLIGGGVTMAAPLNTSDSGNLTAALVPACIATFQLDQQLLDVPGVTVSAGRMLQALGGATDLIDSMLCDLSEANLPSFSAKLVQMVQMVQTVASSNASSAAAAAATAAAAGNCSAIVQNFTRLVTSSNTGRCWSNLTGPVVKLQARLQDYSMLMQLANQVAQLQTVLGPDAASFIGQIFNSIAGSMKSTITIQSLVTSPVTMDTLAKILDTTKEMFNTVTSATISVNSTRVASLSDDQLYAVLCNPMAISRVISFPPVLTVDMSAVSTALCRQMNSSALDRQRVLMSVRTATAPNFGGLDISGWIRAITNVNNLMTQLGQLQSVMDLLKNFDLRKLADYEAAILSLIRTFPGEQVQKIGYALVKDLMGVSNDPVWVSLLTDLNTLFQSLRLFELAKPLFPIKLQVRDFVDDPQAVTQYLLQQGLSPNITSLILQSYLSSEQLFNFSLRLNLPDSLCNANKLSSLLDFSNVSYNASSLVRQLCVNLTLVDIENITETILRMGNFGRFFSRTLGQELVNSLLNSSGLTLTDLKDAVQAVQDSGPALIETFSVIQDMTSVITSFNPGSTNINSPGGLEGMSQAVCGTSGKFNMSSIYGVSVTGSRRRRRATAYDYELGPNLAGNAFCRSMYDLTQQSSAGRIAWSYVKPIIRGKVFVTPNTNVTQNLVSGIQDLFNKLTNLNDLSSSLSGLLPTAATSSGASALTGLLSNPLASSAFSSVLGSSANLTSIQGLLNIFSGNTTSSSTSSNQILQLMQNITGCLEKARIFYYNINSTDYTNALQDALSQNLLLAAVNFENLPTRSRRDVMPSSALPAHVMYTIRMPYGTLYRTDALVAYPEIHEKRDSFLFDLAYQRGFVQLQEAIDRVIVRTHTGRDMPAQQTKQMPSPCMENDSMLRSFGLAILPLCGVFMWLAPLALATQQIMYDREHRLEVPLFLMGLRPSVHFLQWFGIQLFNMLILSVIISVAITYGGLMAGADPSILFVLFALYSFSILGFGYMISSFFITASVACVVALVLYLLTFVPFIFVVYMSDVNVHAMRGLNVFSPTAFSMAARALVTMQLANYQVTWPDLLTYVYQVQVYWNFLALGLDGIGYFLIGWYFRNVLPGKHGIPQGSLFFLTARYWGCDRAGSRPIKNGFGAVVELRNVSKKFGSKQAVKDLNLNLFEGETTVLLGPNGAGKSTTINMMTGLINCDSGKIRINGFDISNSFYKLRSSIGFCPQHNVYYDDMSVKRNLTYFGKLKGCSDADIQGMLSALRLYKVRNVSVKHLSGGQKRRLSIGLAFLGKPSLVILDEPTAAVDPDAKRTIWELIKSYRCTTLVCTHDMQEAEVLGDHVAVLIQGQIVDNRSYADLSESCRYTVTAASESPLVLAEELTRNCQDISPPAANERQGKVAVTCRKEGRSMASLTWTLEQWKAAPRQLVSAFSITCSSVADFFNSLIFGCEVVQDLPQGSRYQMVSGRPTTCGTVGALLIKRFHHTRRSWMSYIGMVLLPVLFIILAMGSTLLRPKFNLESPKLLLTPTNYGPGAVSFLYQTDSPLKGAVKAALAKPPGLGTACMTGNNAKLLYFTAPCSTSAPVWSDQSLSAAELAKYQSYSNCSCTKNQHYVCSDDYSRGAPPNQLNSASGDVIQEMQATTTNLEDLLLRSSTRFNLSGARASTFAPASSQRWGGLELQANASVIWFDNRGYHTLPAYLNAYSNTMLRAYLESNLSSSTGSYGISIYNHPLPMQRSQLSSDSLDTAIKDAGLAMCIVFALCFVPASIGLTVSSERHTGQQLHMRIYGVSVTTYWITSFIWDMLIYLLPMGLVLATMAAFQIDLYVARLNLAAIAMLLGLFGASAIPLTYIVSRWLKSPSGGFLLSFFLLFFVGIVLFCLILLLTYYVNVNNKALLINVLTYIFMSLPSFSLGNGIYLVVSNQWKASVLASYGVDSYVNPFTMDMVGPHVIAMGIGCVVFLTINILSDMRCPRRGGHVRFSYLTEGGSDIGVQEEFDRVNSGASKTDPIQMSGLSMSFTAARSFRIRALDNLTMSVPQGLCLGLLGPNGSGKSTTFNILTGQLASYHGSYSLETPGFCPQVDPLDKEISVSETLAFYSRLLGLPRKDAHKQTDQLIADLRLPPNKVAKSLSGGQRRKLSVAIAFLGAPRCILLDEPSAGLDAVSREALRQLVRCATGQGSSVLFTSHSMDEIESVCDRVAILIGGRLRAIGRLDELKEQLGRSYTLTVRCHRDDKERLTKYLQNTFPTAECKMSAVGVTEYAVPISTKAYEIFNAMETAKGHLCTDYSVKQTTLEQVFLELCSLQSDNWREAGQTPSSGASDNSGPSSSTGSYLTSAKRSDCEETYMCATPAKTATVRSKMSEDDMEKANIYKVYL